MTARMLALVRVQPGPDEQTRTTGVVAEAAVYTGGTSVLRWLTEPHAIETYPSEAAMRQVREASGRSVFCELPAPPAPAALAQLQDEAEQLAIRSGSWVPGEDGRLSQDPVIAGFRDLIARAHAAGACRVAGRVDGLLADFRDDLISLQPFLNQLAELAWQARPVPAVTGATP